MRKQRLNLFKPIRKLGKFPVKLITAALVILLVSCFMISYIWGLLRACNYFKISDIITREASIADFSYLKGKNIFSVDLKKESAYILESCSDCSKIRLVRILPNRLFVDFIKRKPLGLVKLYRYFAVDEDGVFFYTQSQPEESDLPIISGLETKIFGPKPGRKYAIKELIFALNIIRGKKNDRVLKNYSIKEIDVTNADNASIFISLPKKFTDSAKQETSRGPQYLEAKISEDNLQDKIAILSSLVIQAKNDLANIKYIDLRFKEPVIKFKDAK